MNIREQAEEREFQYLSRYASHSRESKGRERVEEECDIRTVYQRDRDRIIHSKAFRRLKDKTQVFLAAQGDHYRTRLTHTLEVSQTARTIAKALELNEDLVEAIALGHDLGHTPFGHAGEAALNEICPEGFAHFKQSVRVVERLEKNGEGLNLTWEVRDGMLNHRTSGTPHTLEGQVVRLCDKISYIHHDMDDAQRAGIFQEDDIMLAISYVLFIAQEQQMPLSICIGLGTSMGAHQGEGPLNEYINSIAAFTQNAVSVPAGNEGTARHHYLREFGPNDTEDTVELRVGDRESTRGFMTEFWGDSPGSYYMTIQSPTGEKLSVSTSLKNSTQELSFVFVETKVLVNYVPIERRTGNTLIFIRFQHPASGIWKFLVEEKIPGKSRFHIWLPVRGMISDETYFLQSSPDYTVTAPGDTEDAMTVTAYQHRDNSLFIQAGRGYNAENIVKPDFAAPGVGILTASIGPGKEFAPATGTSLAAAQTAGIAALLFEWALVRGNEPYFTGNSVKHYLSRGAVREAGEVYPNPDWGYGRVDLYHTFELLT